jgi:hypothetical protein
MRTVLMYDEDKDEFKDKPSNLTVFLLEKRYPEETLTGKEIDLGSTNLNLARYAKEPISTSKLYINGSKEMYIEIVVKSRPVDAKPEPIITPATVLNIFAQTQPLKRNKTQAEPITPEDHLFVEDFKKKE